MQRRGWFDLIHRCANAAPTSTPFGRAAGRDVAAAAAGSTSFNAMQLL